MLLSSAGEYTALPILFAGTMKQYSTKAMPQLTTITKNIGDVLNLRWPYHARVMKMFEQTSSKMGTTYGQRLSLGARGMDGLGNFCWRGAACCAYSRHRRPSRHHRSP